MEAIVVVRSCHILSRDSSKRQGFDSPEALVLMASFLVREFRTEAVEDVGPGQYKFQLRF